MLQTETSMTADRRATPDRRERRRGGRRLSDMVGRDGAAVRLRDLVNMTGFSKMKLLTDIKGGYLLATRVQCGQQSVWLIAYAEAQRYLRDLGLLKP